jgi:hypothetical protein
MECKPRRASIRPGGVLIYTFDRVGAHGTHRFVEQRQRIHMGVGFAPGGELVEVVPFGDQEPLGRGAFDALDVGAAHEVDAAGGSDRLVSLRAPLLVVDILSCSDGPQDGLSVSETRRVLGRGVKLVSFLGPRSSRSSSSAKADDPVNAGLRSVHGRATPIVR